MTLLRQCRTPVVIVTKTRESFPMAEVYQGTTRSYSERVAGPRYISRKPVMKMGEELLSSG